MGDSVSSATLDLAARNQAEVNKRIDSLVNEHQRRYDALKSEAERLVNESNKRITAVLDQRAADETRLKGVEELAKAVTGQAEAAQRSVHDLKRGLDEVHSVVQSYRESAGRQIEELRKAVEEVRQEGNVEVGETVFYVNNSSIDNRKGDVFPALVTKVHSINTVALQVFPDYTHNTDFGYKGSVNEDKGGTTPNTYHRLSSRREISKRQGK